MKKDSCAAECHFLYVKNCFLWNGMLFWFNSKVLFTYAFALYAKIYNVKVALFYLVFPLVV